MLNEISSLAIIVLVLFFLKIEKFIIIAVALGALLYFMKRNKNEQMKSEQDHDSDTDSDTDTENDTDHYCGVYTSEESCTSPCVWDNDNNKCHN